MNIYYDKINDEIHLSISKDGGFIKPVYDKDRRYIDYFDVYYISKDGNKKILDSHCNTLSDAMSQLEMVSEDGC